jgi:hypothetical protein
MQGRSFDPPGPPELKLRLHTQGLDGAPSLHTDRSGRISSGFRNRAPFTGSTRVALTAHAEP